MYVVNNLLEIVGLNSYQLVQFLKEYINPEEIEIFIVISSRIA